ncbi:hypothetical protein [Duncaniella freteri]|nr:hypothetical protein [Duncaniella freteri]
MNKQMTVDDEIAYNNYKLTADKILQLLSQIREDPSASAKRWVWELLQNAKDVPNRFGKVSVEIELISPETLKFRHNGDCFSTKNITGLVQQVSSKDSQNLEGQTGKFGTGFICTHLLSDIIDVEGIVSYMGVHRRFDISLDRSGYRSEDLLPRIASTLEELRHIETTYPIVDNYEASRTEQSFNTVFTYHLTTEEKQKSAIAGLEDLINTLPITLVTQSEKIKQVRVINRINGTDVVYTCNSEDLDENVRLSKVVIDKITKTYLSYITDDVALTTEVILNNGMYEIVKRDNKQPVLYRDFPLIGSEKFYFPYTLNGFEFNPTERRNGLLLNSADHPSCISNRQIVDKAINAVFKFNEWLISHSATNRYLLASSRIPESSEKYSEDVAAPWIKNLQLRWRKQLLDEQLVETDAGVDILRNLSVPAFSTTATKEINEKFFSLLHGKYIGRGVLPKFEHLHGWLEVVRPEYDNWGSKLKYEKDDFLTDLSALQNLSALCVKINKIESETLEWLNNVFKFLVDQNLLIDFDKYAIIPNQKGEFKLLKDLKSDHSSRIPEILKSIYNSVNQDNATVQDILMDASVDATVFGNTLQPFSLKEMIEVLNAYVKQGTNIHKNNTCVDVKSVVAHSLLSLYPNVDDVAYLKKRRNIYEFCKAYRNMSEYNMVNITETDLWKEADNYWFNNSYSAINTNVPTMASTFFVVAKSEEETLAWLNTYLQFYRDNSHGDLIKEQVVFPNQQKCFKKLSELRYDCSIPEEFKDLANRAYNSNSPVDVYRHQLLHRAILGYEQHNPLTIKDIYEYVKKRFDDSNDSTKEAIARHTITIIAKQDSGVPEERNLYDFAKTISGFPFEETKYIETATGFNWGFAQEFYIKLLAQRISNSGNLEGFKGLSTTFTAEENVIGTLDLTHWIDRFIEFLHTYKTKKYWNIITDNEHGIGIWLNQNNNFCRFQDVRKDDNIPEDLKKLCANNVHIKRDFREEMFSLNSSLSSYLETTPVTLKEIGEYIDLKLEHYDGNKQDKDFCYLVFTIGKLCNTIVELKDIMTFYNEKKNALIVGSLGEGTTMDLVGSIVQQGDEKLRAVKEILEDNTIEDLNNIKAVLQICPASQFDKVKELVEKLASDDAPDVGGETPTGGEDKVEAKVELVPQSYEIEVVDSDGNHQLVRTDQVQYAGLSLEEIEQYVSEAKAAVVKYYRELNERNPELGLQFDNERIASHSYSQLYGISDKDGNEIPIVVHSYKGPQYRYFDLNWYDWQLLSKPGSELWILTVSGLQCIPLYALPIRHFSFNLDNLPLYSRAALQTLAAVAKQSLSNNNSGGNITFDFGNVMPIGFVERCCFDFVPEQLENCVNTIKHICESNVSQIAKMYNSGKCIPIKSSDHGYSRALKEVENDVTMAEIFEAKAKENCLPPIIGTTHID